MPIPGTTKLSRLEENLGGTSMVLTKDDLAAIDPGAHTPAGARYPEALERMTGL